MWKEKYDKKQRETELILKLHESLKDDYKDAMIQLDKFVKRTRQMTEEHEDMEKESR